MSNSFLYRKILTPRRLLIDYQSPPICEGDFTSTGVSTISLLPILRPLGPTGLVMEWNGTRWRLTWNIIPGALCYSIYRLNDVLDPFSEWILVAECVENNVITLPPGIYGVTVITLDGESDPSDPIEGPEVDPGDPPPVVPDPEPDVCEGPAEFGDDVPSDLMIPEDTDLGDIVPDTTIPTHFTYWGSFSQAMYEISYQGGAWKDDDNPGPGGFKLTSLRWVWDDTDETDPLLGNSYLGPDQGTVESEYQADCAVYAALCSLQFIHDAGQIGVKMIRFGNATNPVAGSPNPTWKLKRVGTWPSFPNRLRIVDYDENDFGETVQCDALASGQPSWDGTLDTRQILLPFIFSWWSSGAISTTIGGRMMVEAKVTHWCSNPHNASGCGWLLWISFINDDGVIDAWTGIRSKGNGFSPSSPVGKYYRESGCLTGPPCVELESY
jgi:hypothetical protein